MSITITKNISPKPPETFLNYNKKVNAYMMAKYQQTSLRHSVLSRGVYGQRQLGVQMFRTKFHLAE